jgi:hypothetical protein
MVGGDTSEFCGDQSLRGRGNPFGYERSALVEIGPAVSVLNGMEWTAATLE